MNAQPGHRNFGVPATISPTPPRVTDVDPDLILRGQIIPFPKWTGVYEPPPPPPSRITPLLAIIVAAWSVILFVWAVVAGWL